LSNIPPLLFVFVVETITFFFFVGIFDVIGILFGSIFSILFYYFFWVIFGS